ncbi:MAG: hypothetical protein ACHP84_13375 [Caulobacterales bacterium]
MLRIESRTGAPGETAREYWFLLVDARQRRVRSMTLVCLNDDDALGIARVMRAGERAEVWREGRLVGVVSEETGQPRQAADVTEATGQRG